MKCLKFPVLVAGAGNRYMGDDGAGLWVLDTLREKTHDHLELKDCATDLFTLANVTGDYTDVILVDSVRAGASPGSIHWFGPDHVQHFRLSGSVHQLSALEALQLLPLMNSGFEHTRFSVVGIEPGDLSFTSALSSAVNTAVVSLAELLKTKEGVEEILTRCQGYNRMTTDPVT